MKKLLSVFAGVAIAFASLSVQAQTSANTLKSTPAHVPTDTVVNTGNKLQFTGAVAGFADVLTFQYVVTKISGTVAGSLVLQGSLDGVNYVNIGSAVTPTDVAVQSGSFAVGSHNYIFYRLSYTGAGTMSAKLNSYWIARKRTS